MDVGLEHFVNIENENENENENQNENENEVEITCNITNCINLLMTTVQLNYVIILLISKEELNLFGTSQQKINFLYYTYFLTYTMRYAITTEFNNHFKIIYNFFHFIFDITIIINTIISYKYLNNSRNTTSFLVLFYILAIWYGIIFLSGLLIIILKYYYRARISGNRVISWDFNIENMRFEKTEIILPEFIRNYDKENITEDMPVCCICMDKMANCHFEPCNHKATCYNCSKIWCYEKYKNTCPICRVVITKIYTYD